MKNKDESIEIMFYLYLLLVIGAWLGIFWLRGQTIEKALYSTIGYSIGASISILLLIVYRYLKK